MLMLLCRVSPIMRILSSPSRTIRLPCMCFFFSSRRRHTRLVSDWSSDVCSSDLPTWRRWAMASDRALVPTERLEQAILTIRGQKVMLDADLAVLYGVETRVLLQAVRRNSARFPADFAFQRSEERRVGKECSSGCR